MHVPSGLFASFSAGEVDDTTESYWYVNAGIEKTWLSYGTTTIYGEYGQYDGAGASLTITPSDSVVTPFPIGVALDVDGDETMWGAGITQRFDAAALDVYLQYRHVEGDFDIGGFSLDTEFDTFLLGTSIAF
jgi:hypothetical protein